jgi:hypothetical protein
MIVDLNEAWARGLPRCPRVRFAISLGTPTDEAIVASVRGASRALDRYANDWLGGQHARHILHGPGHLRGAEAHGDTPNRDTEGIPKWCNLGSTRKTTKPIPIPEYGPIVGAVLHGQEVNLLDASR